MIRSARAFGRAWGPATLWLAVLFLLSHQPDSDVPGWWSVPDTLAHVALYTVLGATLAWGRRQWRGPSWLALGIFGVVWAISDEWHQSFVPGRDPSTGDVLADVVGLLLGAVGATFALHILASPASSAATTPIDAPS